jgi:hypothetical protein
VQRLGGTLATSPACIDIACALHLFHNPVEILITGMLFAPFSAA